MRVDSVTGPIHRASITIHLNRACISLTNCVFTAATTGSAVAFGKLHGIMPSKPLSLPGKNLINMGMGIGSVAAGAQFLTTGDPAAGLVALGATTALGGAMGAHMTASIGGADMPVVSNLITVIDSQIEQELVTK